MNSSNTKPLIILVLAVFTFLIVGASAVTCAAVWPLPKWSTATPAQMGMDVAKLRKARDYALTGGGSGYIIRGGKLVETWS